MVTVEPGGASCTVVDATSCVITGLVPGRHYRFTVAAAAQGDHQSSGPANASTQNAAVRLRPVTVYFSSNSTHLSAAARTALTELVRQHRRVIRIAGYTDSTGTPASNLVLARNRAAAVASFIAITARRLHVASPKMELVAYGQTHPAASNATPAGRARNRRAVVVIVLP